MVHPSSLYIDTYFDTSYQWHTVTVKFFVMLADYIPSTLDNFKISYPIGFSCRNKSIVAEINDLPSQLQQYNISPPAFVVRSFTELKKTPALHLDVS